MMLFAPGSIDLLSLVFYAILIIVRMQAIKVTAMTLASAGGGWLAWVRRLDRWRSLFPRASHYN